MSFQASFPLRSQAEQLYNFLIESMQIIKSGVYHRWDSRSVCFTLRGSRSQGKADMVKLSHGKDSRDLITMVSSVCTCGKRIGKCLLALP